MRTTAKSTTPTSTLVEEHALLSSPGLTVTTPRREGSTSDAAVLRVRGDLDMVTAPQLHDVLHERLARTDRAVVDLSDVDFLGTAGIEVLVQLAQQVRLALVARGPALRAITVTGADADLAVHSGLVDAERSLNGPRTAVC